MEKKNGSYCFIYGILYYAKLDHCVQHNFSEITRIYDLSITLDL